MQSRTFGYWVIVLSWVSVLALTAAQPLRAQSGNNFYAGKTVTFLVGSSAGGGTDVTARLLARHLERYIPGKPRIDVVNKPGAGGMIASNELYNLKKPDGLSISTMNTGSLFATATGNEAIRFDLKKFIWVGQAFDDAQVVYLKTSTPYTSFDAIRKANKEGKQPKMGAQALDHTSNVVVKIVEQIFGLDFTVIPGYPGTPQILLDIERGALDGRAQGIGSLMSTRREWAKNGYIKLLATSKKERDPRIPDVAPMEEIAPAGSKGLLNALYAGQNLARSVVLPPNVPADRVKVLRDAFASMTKDEQFLKESEKLGLEVDLIRGEEMNRDIEATLGDKRLMDLYRMIGSAK
ncbi:MAG: Bug family tripartite tricarboxylate transporter substrate binding protein [Candidatus Binatia bacterium]